MTDITATKMIQDSVLLDKINETMDKYIRPSINADGGDITVVDFDSSSGILYVELSGMCVGCMRAYMTLENLVGNTLRNLVSPNIQVKLV